MVPEVDDGSNFKSFRSSAETPGGTLISQSSFSGFPSSSASSLASKGDKLASDLTLAG